MELIYISNSVNVDELRDCRQFERRRTPKLANVGCVEWKWWAKRWRRWEAQISSSGWHHHSAWVNTHTTLVTHGFRRAQPSMSHDLPTHIRWHTELVWVCVSDHGPILIHLFIYRAEMMMPFTFRCRSSRHFMSFKPIPLKLCAATETSIFPMLP